MNPLWLLLIVPATVALTLLYGRHRHAFLCREMDRMRAELEELDDGANWWKKA